MPAVPRTSSLSSLSLSTSAPSGPSPRIPRPPNPWILYRSSRAETHKLNPLYSNLTQMQLSQLIAQEWARESPEIKDSYTRLAQRKKEEHQAMYPEYTFRPVRKVEKERRRAEAKAERERIQEEMALVGKFTSVKRASARMVYPPVLPCDAFASSSAGASFKAPQQPNALMLYDLPENSQYRHGSVLTMQEPQTYLDTQTDFVQGSSLSHNELERMMLNCLNPFSSVANL